MSIQRHPVDSFSPTLNFWEEFPDFKIHRKFGDFWRANKKAGQLELSSKFMWALSLCYDRKSVFFAQPEIDKWEVVSEDLFGDKNFMSKLAEDPDSSDLIFLMGGTLFNLIDSFEECIDTPLGVSLRAAEKKLQERDEFIKSTKYSTDYYEEVKGRTILRKGTADQLDKMVVNTDKIVSRIKTLMDELRNAEAEGVGKGGGETSLSDGDKNF